MQLAGTYLLNAPPEKVWPMLMDPNTLAGILPGVSKLEKSAENTFKSIIEIKLGPVNGSFTGHLYLENLQEPTAFTLKVQQNSKIGNANAAIKIDLIPVEPGKTQISFDGDVKMTGLLASMGQRVVSSVSNVLTKQFFTNLEKELEKDKIPG
ncbi:MAG: carbon monoxide dehydrogenase subunit G [Bacteroidota bacterium]